MSQVRQRGPAPLGRATLRAIAQKAGVHVSTVSRTLRATEDGRAVSTAAGARVISIAKELGYEPDPWGGMLASRPSRALGVLVPRLTDVVLATIYENIDKTAAQAGYLTLVANTDDSAMLQRERVESLLSRRVDGLILGDAHHRAPFLKELADRGVPFVLVSRRSGSHPAVTCDDNLGGALAAQHLLSLGHENLAVLAGAAYASTGKERTCGFLTACRDSGVEVPVASVRAGGFDVASGHAAADAVLDTRHPPTAIFAVNDYMAIGAMGAARRRGLQVGHDISIIGFNDIGIAADLPIPLTTVRSPIEEMGTLAAKKVIALLNGEQIEGQRLTPQLVVRESTAAVRH
jgi:LacI family transcriptional regulator